MKLAAMPVPKPGVSVQPTTEGGLELVVAELRVLRAESESLRAQSRSLRFSHAQTRLDVAQALASMAEPSSRRLANHLRGAVSRIVSDPGWTVGERTTLEERLRNPQSAPSGHEGGTSGEKSSRFVKEGTRNEPRALTRRESEVLARIAEGYSTKQIAASLGIAIKTAACHRFNIMAKLGIHDTVLLVRYAIRKGLAQA